MCPRRPRAGSSGMHRFRKLLAAGAALCTVTMSARGADEPSAHDPRRGKAEHVVLVAWDGMRPDFATEANAPTLWKLAARGTTFRNHHSVYPSVTNVNATVLATGVHPDRSGIIGNYEYRPALESAHLVRTDEDTTIAQADAAPGGKYIGTPTVSEIVQANGGSCAVAGTKSAALLHNRKPAARSGNVTIFEGKTVPPSALSEVVKALGAFPEKKSVPNAAQDAWTTRALTDVLWKDGVPEFSVLWMSEPDRAQHASGPGSPEALAAIKSADANLSVVIRALQDKEALDRTDILVVSDHGFSTIERAVDLTSLLRDAGFSLAGGEAPARGEIRMGGNGGTVFFYIGEHDRPTAQHLVEWLQQSDFAGVILSAAGGAGTFRLADFHLDSPSAPDVAVSMRWTDLPNEYGVRGSIAASKSKDAAAGTHGSLSPFDLHNILFVAGPDFREGLVSNVASSNLDVAPTILQILGLKSPERMDGRILAEGLKELGDPPAESKQSRTEVRSFNGGEWRQYVRTTKVGDQIYIDEGNGELHRE